MKLKVKRGAEATVDGLRLLRELRPSMGHHTVYCIVRELRSHGEVTLNPRSDNEAEQLALAFTECGLTAEYID